MSVSGMPRSDRGLRIGVDMISAGSAFAPGVGGMVSYYEGLLSALCELDRVAGIVSFVPPWNNGLALPPSRKLEPIICHGLVRSRTARVAYEQLVLPVLAARHKLDVLLCTVNVVPLMRRAPSVVVLQSLQYYTLPGQFGRLRRAYLHRVVPWSLRRANQVITVSDTVRADVLSYVKLDPRKMTTVYHGAQDRPSPDSGVGEAYALPDGAPYIVMVSRLYEHKNHRRLISAFAQFIGRHDTPHHLVIVGADADLTRAELSQHARAEGIADRVHCLGMISADQVDKVYAGATAAAYVSLYETFGHPVLEAFAFGLPLVTSSIGSTGEIAGGAARLVDPRSTESIEQGLYDVLLDPTVRARLSAAGTERLREFTWRRCAEQTLAVLEQACGRPIGEPLGSNVHSPSAA